MRDIYLSIICKGKKEREEKNILYIYSMRKICPSCPNPRYLNKSARLVRDVLSLKRTIYVSNTSLIRHSSCNLLILKGKHEY